MQFNRVSLLILQVITCVWYKMGNKFGIIQTTNSLCVLYKEDDEGKESFFTVLHPTTSNKSEGKIIVFIDHEYQETENVFIDNISSPKHLLQIFDEWADDAPVVFQMEAYSYLLTCASDEAYLK